MGETTQGSPGLIVLGQSPVNIALTNMRITSYGKRKRREIGETPVRAVAGEDPLDRWLPSQQNFIAMKFLRAHCPRWSGGRSKRRAEASLGEEVLVTHAFRISDTFTKKKKNKEEEQGNENRIRNPARKEPKYSSTGSLAYDEQDHESEEITFDPDHLEV